MNTQVISKLFELDKEIFEAYLKKEIIKYVEDKYKIDRILTPDCRQFSNSCKIFNNYNFYSFDEYNNCINFHCVHKDYYKNYDIYIFPETITYQQKIMIIEHGEIKFANPAAFNLSKRLQKLIDDKQKEKFTSLFLDSKSKNIEFNYNIEKIYKPKWLETFEIFE